MKNATKTIKTADVHMGRLTDLMEACNALAPETVQVDVLTLVVLLKRAEDALAKFRANLSDEANKEFTALMTAEPLQKIWPIGNIGSLTKYTPAGTWLYPPNVIQAINNAEREKAIAQANKTAQKEPGQVKPGGFLFSISLAAPELGCEPKA